MPFKWAAPNPVVAGSTEILATHVTQVRTNINTDRNYAPIQGNLTPPATKVWAEVITTGVTEIKASHFTEMMTALDEAYDANVCTPYESAYYVPDHAFHEGSYCAANYTDDNTTDNLPHCSGYDSVNCAAAGPV